MWERKLKKSNSNSKPKNIDLLLIQKTFVYQKNYEKSKLIFEFLQYVLRICLLADIEIPTRLPSLLAHMWLNTQFMANFFLYAVGNRRFRAALRCRRRMTENEFATMNNTNSRTPPTLQLHHMPMQKQPTIVIASASDESEIGIEHQN